jgi:cell division protein FtsX
MLSEEVLRELAIGLVGSLLGAAALAIVTFGWRFSRGTIAESQKTFASEIAKFDQSNDLGKQMISQDYLFDAMKWFFVGNLLTTIGSVALGFGFGSNGVVLLLSVFLLAATAIAYVVALSKVLRFNKIKRLARSSPSISSIKSK